MEYDSTASGDGKELLGLAVCSASWLLVSGAASGPSSGARAKEIACSTAAGVCTMGGEEDSEDVSLDVVEDMLLSEDQ